MGGLIKLSNERVWRTYIGGSLIDKFHGCEDCKDTHFPEEWIMSCVEGRNSGREDVKHEGLSKAVETGELLTEVINKNPQKLLGAKHYSKYVKSLGVLIKLIDSAERLSVQVHPDKKNAKKYFNSDYGKTESWHIIGGREINGEKPYIYLGFKEGIERKCWKEAFDTQNIPAMLSCLNKIYVQKGDTFLIKGGVPHAIGAGCFLIEVQEPTDYTIRTERITPSGFKIADFMCHQGIGFDNMMNCFDYTGMSLEDTIGKYKLKSRENGKYKELITYEDTKCFALSILETESEYTLPPEDSFYGMYVLDGKGMIETDGKAQKTEKGNQFFVGADTELRLIPRSRIKIAKLYGPEI